MKLSLLTIAAAALLLEAPALAAETYVVIYDGAPKGLQEKFERLSNLSKARRAYPTAAALRRVGAEDRKILVNALTAAGYYAARVDFRVEPATGGGLAKAHFAIEAGPLFRIERHQIVYRDDRATERPESFESAGLIVDDRADGAALAANQQLMLDYLWNAGFPAARIVARRAEADEGAAVATAVYEFESGPRAKFGDVEISGATHTDEGFLRKQATFTDGETFDRQKLIAYRARLAALGIFSSIEAKPGAVSTKGEAPVLLNLVERKRRTIGVGASYSTAEGPGGRFFFEYRNLFRHAERARFDIEGAALAQSARLDLTRPLPGFPGSAFASAAFRRESTDAFDARTVEIGAGLVKKWFDGRLETQGGLGLETSRVEPKLAAAPGVGVERNYFVSAPLSATWSTEDGPLTLAKGVRASLFVTPYAGSDQFTRLETTIRSRIALGEDDRFTLAGRARIAATAGQALRTLPVNKRVYSGGGSSVRGYDYQAVGPLDANGVPIGGRSGVEAAIEARARVLTRLELAAFADAGAVYSESFPDLSGDYLVGAGLGFRYLSNIGPLRFDAAIPLERRPSDRAFQIYISLGQPF